MQSGIHELQGCSGEEPKKEADRHGGGDFFVFFDCFPVWVPKETAGGSPKKRGIRPAVSFHLAQRPKHTHPGPKSTFPWALFKLYLTTLGCAAPFLLFFRRDRESVR